MFKDPFIEKNRRSQPGFNMGLTLGNKTVWDEEVGLEIELEGNKFPYPNDCYETPTKISLKDEFGLEFWSYVHDGSLRGQANAEYVLTKPVKFSSVKPALTELFKKLKEYGSEFDESNRTSIHVHLNCQSFHINRLATFMALWFTFEDILTQWCGEHRVGNLFCLRGGDATAIVSHLRKFIKSDGKYDLSDHLHYAGLNANALKKFGSLEVRTMRGVSDPKIILNWVEILQRVYEFSGTIKDPRDVCGMFSSHGPMQMFNAVFGPKVPTIRTVIDWDDERIRKALFKGIRLAQDICFCRDWDLYKPQEIREDPFNRSKAKIVKKVLGTNIIDELLEGPWPGSVASVSISTDSGSYFTTTPGWSSPYHVDTEED